MSSWSWEAAIVLPILEKRNLPSAFCGYSGWRKVEKLWELLGPGILPLIPPALISESTCGGRGRDPRGLATIYTRDWLGPGRKQVLAKAWGKD